jgi:2-polyprenyl-3-methyl-5-hydroxy-6-metoxy-1,4-benzoquinol methylase
MQKSGLLRTTSYDKEYYEEHKAAGLDYAVYGDWQREYGQWVADCMGWRGKNVLDIGCACGSITKGMKDSGVKAFGIDLNEHAINLGRCQWNDIPLFVGDTVNMHMFHNERFNGIHSHQTLEHLKPDLVPFVLQEMWRISAPGATMFAVLDTEDSFNRQHRNGEDEDPTHVCIRPRSWWSNMLKISGWEECSDEFKKGMQTHVHNFLTRYDWDWFVAKKRS